MKTNANYPLLLGKCCNNCYYANKPEHTQKCNQCVQFHWYKPKEKAIENN